MLELSSVMAIAAVRSLPENARWLSRAARAADYGQARSWPAACWIIIAAPWRKFTNPDYFNYWFREFRPYLRGAVRQFSTKHVSLTERLLSLYQANRNSP